MIEIRLINQYDDGITWSWQLYGPDAAGVIRAAVIERVLSAGQTPADWLAANQAEAQQLIDAGQYNEELAQRLDLADLNQKRLAEITFLQGELDNWATLTAGRKDAVLKRLVQENLALLRQLLPIVARRLV